MISVGVHVPHDPKEMRAIKKTYSLCHHMQGFGPLEASKYYVIHIYKMGASIQLERMWCIPRGSLLTWKQANELLMLRKLGMSLGDLDKRKGAFLEENRKSDAGGSKKQRELATK
jgi:hypothetical protein